MRSYAPLAPKKLTQVLAIVLIFAAQKAYAQQESMAECNGANIAQSITACTTLIISTSSQGVKAEALRNRGIRYQAKGDFESAGDDFNSALAIFPNNALLLSLRGSVFSRQSKLEAAKADFDRAVELEPSLTFAYLGRSYLEYATGRFVECVADATKAISLDPKQASAFSNRGAAYRELGDYGKSINDLGTAIQLSPRLARPLYQRGLTYFRMGDAARALTDYDAALAIDPNEVDAAKGREAALGFLNPNASASSVAPASPTPTVSAGNPTTAKSTPVDPQPTTSTPMLSSTLFLRPSTTYGLVRIGPADGAVGSLVFSSRGAIAQQILAQCKIGELCQVTANAINERAKSVLRVERIPPFRDPGQLMRFVYSRVVNGSTRVDLVDDDIDALFTNRLADLLRKARRASLILESESSGDFNWDNAQESDIRSVKIQVDDAGSGRALGLATFRNFANSDPVPITMTFDLVRTPLGWRIDDQQFPLDGGSQRFGNAQRLSVKLQIEIAEGLKEERSTSVKEGQKRAVAAVAAAMAPPGKLCAPQEGTIFTCRTGDKIVAVCASAPIGTRHEWIEYRFGVRDRLEMSHRSEDLNFNGSFNGAYEIFPRGEESYVRFKKGNYEYIMFEDEASRPQTAGVLVRKSGRLIGNLRCDGGSEGSMPTSKTQMPSNLISAEVYDADRLADFR